MWIIGGIVAIIGIGSGYLFLHRNSAPIPQAIRTSFDFPLFYPSKLPEGWRIDDKSFSKGVEVLTYTAITDTNQKVVISIQPQPKAFDFDNFYKETLGKSSQFTATLGQGATGEGEGGYKIGSLTTGDSWILISTTSKDVSAKDLRETITGMKEAKD